MEQADSLQKSMAMPLITASSSTLFKFRLFVFPFAEEKKWQEEGGEFKKDQLVKSKK